VWLNKKEGESYTILDLSRLLLHLLFSVLLLHSAKLKRPLTAMNLLRDSTKIERLNPIKVSNFHLLSLAKVQQKFCKSAEKIPQNVKKVFDKSKIKKRFSLSY
jgi:hypothetical protein